MNPSNANTQIDTDLRSAELTIRQLQAEIRTIKAAPQAEPVRRKPLDRREGASTEPDRNEQFPTIGANDIKRRRLRTAENLEVCLISASELLSSASTITAEGGRISSFESISHDPARVQKLLTDGAMVRRILPTRSHLSRMVALVLARPSYSSLKSSAHCSGLRACCWRSGWRLCIAFSGSSYRASFASVAFAMIRLGCAVNWVACSIGFGIGGEICGRESPVFR